MLLFETESGNVKKDHSIGLHQQVL